MKTSKLSVIWANRPGCRLAAAEFWMDEEQLWFTIFFDDEDRELKMEVLPSLENANVRTVDLPEVERLIAAAKQDLLAMSAARETGLPSAQIEATSPFGAFT